MKDTLDYLGFDHYTGTAADNPASAQSMAARWNTKLQPEDIYYVARHYAQRYPGLPIYVVENGMVTDNAKPRTDGVTRSQYLSDTVFWLQRAKADGIPIIGYNYWSLIDNYEWAATGPASACIRLTQSMIRPCGGSRPTPSRPTRRSRATAGRRRRTGP